MRLLSTLMPQERKFFALFNQHASLVVQGAAALVEMLSDYSDNGKRDAYVARIQSIEHAADQVTHQTVALMHNTFVTPFDRDQINKLIQRMDDILDLMQDTAESLTLYADGTTEEAEPCPVAPCIARFDFEVDVSGPPVDRVVLDFTPDAGVGFTAILCAPPDPIENEPGCETPPLVFRTSLRNTTLLTPRVSLGTRSASLA